MEFQFLIGRLRTQVEKMLYDYKYLFQFLIGRLRTMKRIPSFGCGTTVSIPHR